MSTLIIKEGTTWPTPGVIANNDGSAMDLTDITVSLVFNESTRDLTVVEAAAGVVAIPWAEGELVPGVFDAEFVFTSATEGSLPSKTFKIRVDAKVPAAPVTP